MITAQKKTNEKPVVLVVGGAGFIGSFLCETLLLQDCRVVCLDNLSTGKKENLAKCLQNRDFSFIKHDATKPLPSELKSENFSYIFDLVGQEFASKNFWQLAAKTRAKLLIVASESFPQELFRKDFPQVDFRIVCLDDVYGPRMNFEDINLLTQEISRTQHLFITDAIFGITKAMFSSGTTGKTFYLTTKGEEKLKWRPKVDLKEGIGQTLKFLKVRQPGGPKVAQPTGRGLNFKSLVFVLGVFLFVFLTPFILLFFDTFLGVINLQKAKQAFLAADFEKATRSGLRAEKFLKKAEIKARRLRVTTLLEKPFKLGGEVAKGLTEASLAAENVNALVDFIFQDKPGDISKLISQIKTDLDQTYYHFSLIQGELKASKLDYQVVLNERLPEVKELVAEARKGIQLLPRFIGLDKKQTYLVLLQNNNELRPTGGFIGSFALITFEKGRLLDFEIQDVYWADGQLKGHVEPPQELKKYLGEANWYLRDSNWSPDFPTSAVRAKWFLEKETGRVVDGVFGVNLFLVQRLLAAIVELELPDYKEKITDSNLFERAQYYSEIGFFPGSTQKQDFLGTLTGALFEKIEKSEGKTQIEIGRAIYQSLKSKDLLVYLNDPSAMEIISEFGWDGGVKNVKCQVSSVKCAADYLMIVESNVGVNKANYFVKRELSHEVEVKTNGEVKKVLKIIYQNDSPSENFPGGKYKNYLRILTPQESQLEKVLVDGQELSGEKIDVSDIASKTSFGFLIEVPVKERKVVEISYHLGNKIQLTEKSQYLFLVQKQSGTKEEKFNLRMSVPPGVAVLPTYLFNQDFSQDIVFEMFLVR